MAMAVPDPGPWTVARFKAFESPRDGNRYELLDGALLVTPAPKLRHQRVVLQLVIALDAYVARHGLGEVLLAPLDVIVADDTVLEPDVLVIGERPADRREEDPIVPELLLAIEVLSPSSHVHDLGRKRVRLQRAGLVAYWVADPDARTLTTWGPADDVGISHAERLAWQPVPGVPPLALDVRALFAAALDR